MKTPFGAERSSDDLVSRIAAGFPMAESLRRDLIEMSRERVRVSAGQGIIAAGDPFDGVLLIEEGWVVRSRWLPGGGRQIVNVALPGDFLCFNAIMSERSEFDLIARTPVVFCRLKAQGVDRMMSDHPALVAALMWANAREESLLAERVVSLGRRDALARLAHVICELAARLEALGLHDGEVLSLPLIQEDFADLLGLSSIHVTRTFKRLSELGAVDYRSGRLRLKRMDLLRRISGFDADYLHFTQKNAHNLPPHS